MINPMTVRWQVYDSWAAFPEQAGTMKRSVSVVPEGQVHSPICLIGGFHPQATEFQANAIALARHIVDTHNATLG